MRKLVSTLFAVLLAVVSAAAFAEGTLHPFEPDSLAKIVEKQKGKRFVLLVWSLDCVFCHASLKALSQARLKDKDFKVVTISTDAISDPQAASLMREHLASFGMTSDAWAFGVAPPDQLRFAIDPKWHGVKPRSYWFKAHGEKIAYSGVLTAAMIEELSSR